MRILYGVVGEGMGHATRSKVILDHLVKSHEVHVVASGRAHDFLKARFEGTKRIWGYTLAYQDGAVSAFETVRENLEGALSGWPKNIRRYFELMREMEPEIVISDFESWSYLYAKNHRLPVVSIDNMQVINRCEHAPEILEGYEHAFRLAKAVVKAKLPGAYRYLVTSFFKAPVRKARTQLVPSILRDEILAAKPERGDHFLVYQTSTSNEGLPDLLKASGIPCRIYGFERDLKAPRQDGKLTFMPFSEAGFVEDLRTARAVLANGGFTLMSEAVHLRKPVLSVPIAGQFEQVLNARYLQREGYGHFAERLTAESLGAFLEAIPDCARKLEGHHQDGNAETFAALDELLDRARSEEGMTPVG